MKVNCDEVLTLHNILAEELQSLPDEAAFGFDNFEDKEELRGAIMCLRRCGSHEGEIPEEMMNEGHDPEPGTKFFGWNEVIAWLKGLDSEYYDYDVPSPTIVEK